MFGNPFALPNTLIGPRKPIFTGSSSSFDFMAHATRASLALPTLPISSTTSQPENTLPHQPIRSINGIPRPRLPTHATGAPHQTKNRKPHSIESESCGFLFTIRLFSLLALRLALRPAFESRAGERLCLCARANSTTARGARACARIPRSFRRGANA